jgi:predicted transcriptional regulator of viral defense system
MGPMKQIPSERAVRAATEIFRRYDGTMRTNQAADAGIHYTTLYWMRDMGLLERLTRGVYRLAEMGSPGKHDVVSVLARSPGAVLCLVSALDFHGVGTQIPSAVNIAIGRKAREPHFDYPPVRVYRMSGPALDEGIEEHVLDGVTVRVFSEAKTVADCFKFRNKIRLDVAIEALQETVRARRVAPAEIMRFAQIDRVAKIMRPYLAALQ